MQGMDEQVFAVAVAHRVGVVSRRRIAVQPHKIGVIHIKVHHLGFHTEQLRRKIGVYLRVNPPFAHVDVEFLVRYRFGGYALQCPCRDFRPIPFPAGQVVKA